MNWLPLIATQRIRQQRCRWKSCAFSAITLSQSRPQLDPHATGFSLALPLPGSRHYYCRAVESGWMTPIPPLGSWEKYLVSLSTSPLPLPSSDSPAGREEGREGGRYQPALPTTRPGHHRDSFHNEPTHPSAAAFSASGQIMGINCRKARNGRPPTRECRDDSFTSPNSSLI